MRLGGRALAASLLTLAGSLGPQSVLALGLGDLTLYSSLGEPLDASIVLSELDSADAAQIYVGLAPENAFLAAGLEHPAFLNDVQFHVEVLPGNQGLLRLRSVSEVDAPAFGLLLELIWPDGRLLGAYRLAVGPGGEATFSPLDPPPATVSTSEPSGSAAPGAALDTDGTGNLSMGAAQPGAPGSGVQAASPYGVATPDGLSGEAAPRGVPTAAEEALISTWKVLPQDTLWSIASATRPDDSVSVQQMMLALLRANPDAFIGANINGLLTGSVLRIPEREEIEGLSRDEAAAQVEQQNQSFLAGAAADADAEGAAGAVGGEAGARTPALGIRLADAAASPSAGADERLAPAGEAPDRLAADEAAARIAELERQLMQGADSLERSRQENQALQERVAALEAQLTAVQGAARAGRPDLGDSTPASTGGEGQGPAPAQTASAARDEGRGMQNANARRVVQSTQPATALPVQLRERGAALLGSARERLGALVAASQPQVAALARQPAVLGAGLGVFLLALLALLLRSRRRRLARAEARERREQRLAAAVAPASKAASPASPTARIPDGDSLATNLHAGEEAKADLADLEAQIAELNARNRESGAMPAQEPGAGGVSAPLSGSGSASPDPMATTEQGAGSAVAPVADASVSVSPEPGNVAGAPESRPLPPVPDPGADAIFDFDDPDFAAGLFEGEEDGDEDPPFGADEPGSKLDLAVAYEAMGDLSGALEILAEVIAEGSPEQVDEARALRARWQGLGSGD